MHAHVALQLHRLEFSARRRNTSPATCRCALPQLDVRRPALAESLDTISARTDTISSIYELQQLATLLLKRRRRNGAVIASARRNMLGIAPPNDSHAKARSHVARWLPKFDTPSSSSLVSRLMEILQVESTATRVQHADGCGLDNKSRRSESIYIDRIAAHPAGFSPRLN